MAPLPSRQMTVGFAAVGLFAFFGYAVAWPVVVLLAAVAGALVLLFRNYVWGNRQSPVVIPF